MGRVQSFKIVKMRESQIAEVYEIAQRANLAYWSRQDYHAEINRNDSYCLTAESDKNETLGFLVSRLIMQEAYLELYNIAVEGKYQRQGIAGKLLSALIKHCITNQLKIINLEVRESNLSAIRLYQKFGFQLVGVRKSFYKNPPENALTMTKYLIEQRNGEEKT